jgi:hypothetical protein
MASQPQVVATNGLVARCNACNQCSSYRDIQKAVVSTSEYKALQKVSVMHFEPDYLN